MVAYAVDKSSLCLLSRHMDLSSKKLYEPFRYGDMVTLRDRLSGKSMRKPVALNFQQMDLLEKLEIKMPKMIM